MIELPLPQFVNLGESDQLPYIKNYALLYAQQFSRVDLDEYCSLADRCRAIFRHPKGAKFLGNLLPHRIALNFFVQPSSRTFLSFSAAQAILGIKRMSLRDLNISSMSKGESLEDSIRTFISYVDLVVMRHYDDNAAAIAFWVTLKSHRRVSINGEDRPIPIISGGSGTRQHPTQALLDIYTLNKSFEKEGGIDNKKIMLVGDLKRGRTVRSLSYLMKNYENVTLYFAAPKEYQMKEDILEFLDNCKIPYFTVDSISQIISEVDAIYMTRIQDEWDGEKSDIHPPAQDDFIFKKKFLGVMKQSACLLHPLPKRDEIDYEVDYADDPRVVYWRQERNGMWMRVAIIAKIFGCADKISDFRL